MLKTKDEVEFSNNCVQKKMIKLLWLLQRTFLTMFYQPANVQDLDGIFKIVNTGWEIYEAV